MVSIPHTYTPSVSLPVFIQIAAKHTVSDFSFVYKHKHKHTEMHKNKKGNEDMVCTFFIFFYLDILPALFFTFMPINHAKVNRTEIESEIMRCHVLLFLLAAFCITQCPLLLKTMESDIHHQLRGRESKHFNPADVPGETGVCIECVCVCVRERK